MAAFKEDDLGTLGGGLKGTRQKKAFYKSPAGQKHIAELKLRNTVPPTTARGKRRLAKRNGG